MDDERHHTDVVATVRSLFADAATALRGAGARTEALAAYVPPRRALLGTRDATMRPIGRVWRLGVLLLADDGSVHGLGRTTRVTEPGRRQYQAVSVEQRRAYRAAAVRGRFPLGDTVDFDTTPIDLGLEGLRAGAGPLFLRGDAPYVRWNASLGDDAAVPLQAYLEDRVALLVSPPEGA